MTTFPFAKYTLEKTQREINYGQSSDGYKTRFEDIKSFKNISIVLCQFGRGRRIEQCCIDNIYYIFCFLFFYLSFFPFYLFLFCVDHLKLQVCIVYSHLTTLITGKSIKQCFGEDCGV